MSKYHHKDKAEKYSNRAHGAAHSYNEMLPYHVSGEDDNYMQSQSQEKGGYDLDNWLEVEQHLKNSDQDIARLINEGGTIRQML